MFGVPLEPEMFGEFCWSILGQKSHGITNLSVFVGYTLWKTIRKW